MRGARLTPLFLGALAVLVTACGASPRESASSSLQSNLRSLASGAPAGGRAYWLGPAFDGAPVTFADASWGGYAILTYSRLEDVDVDVETFRGRAVGQSDGFRVRTRTPTGQDVLLLFRTPARPSARLIREARKALAPIPLRLTYP